MMRRLSMVLRNAPLYDRGWVLYNRILARNPLRQSAMRDLVHFYGGFIRPGDLCFDIGAYTGSKTTVFRELGARVIAVEPQPSAARVLRRRFRDGVTVVQAAVAESEGTRDLYENDHYAELSSLAPDWVAAAERQPGLVATSWSRRLSVPTTTLDNLIAEHGLPSFCKIDIEGEEGEALLGLSRPIPHICFEFLPFHPAGALGAVSALNALAPYEFNYCRSEAEGLLLGRWVRAEEITAFIERSTLTETHGYDIHARRR